MIKLVVAKREASEINEFLRAAAPNETGLFCLLREGLGHAGKRLVVGELMPPPEDAWDAQGEAWLRPSARHVSMAISRAVSSGAGLVFIHSHPSDHFPTGMSPSDMAAFEALASALAGTFDGPFAAVVVHPQGWSGILWSRGSTETVGSIVEVGENLRFLGREGQSHADSPRDEMDARQLVALGERNTIVRGLAVGVVGCGGLGSAIAEQLSRIGVARIILVDNDIVDTPSNVRRLVGSSVWDLETTSAPAKVDVVGRHLRGIGLTRTIERVRGDIRAEGPFRRLLDADVVICGTDTHGSRAILNELPYLYYLPVVDVGVRVSTRADGNLEGLIAEVRTLTPSRPCLWCHRAINSDVIRAENLPPHELAGLRREGYVAGSVGEHVASVVSLTGLGASMATSAFIGLVCEVGERMPSAYWVDGLMGDSLVGSVTSPRPDCRCRLRLGMADSALPPFIPS